MPRTTSPPRISVIVPCYNEENNIAAALEALTHQNADFPYEILVVDSSTDRTPEIVREKFPSVVLIHSPTRLSCGSARNLGLQRAQASRILFTDADVRVPPDWVTLLAKGLESADGVGAPIANGTPWSLTGTVNYYLEFCRLLPQRRGQMRRRWAFFAGANAGYKRDALEGKEFLGASIGEDIILNHRLLAEGRKLHYYPEPAVRHLNKRGFRRIARYQFLLGVGGWRWRSYSGRGNRWVMQWPILMVAAPAVMLGYLLWHHAKNRSPIGFAKIVGISPFLVGFHAFWVAGFIAGAKVCARDRASIPESLSQVLVPHGELIAARKQTSSSGVA